MKIFETNVNGQTFGYKVGVNSVVKITKTGNKVQVFFELETGKIISHFDLTKLAFYSIG